MQLLFFNTRCSVVVFLACFCSGQKKVCLLFFMLHLFVAIWKRVNANPSVWIASICLSLASSIFFFNFETWMVVEHEKVCDFAFVSSCIFCKCNVYLLEFLFFS